MEKQYIKTSNLDLASTLLASGVPIDGIYARGQSGTYDFYFTETEELKKMIEDFWARRLRVEPQELLGARKEIITRMKENEESVEKPFQGSY